MHDKTAINVDSLPGNMPCPTGRKKNNVSVPRVMDRRGRAAVLGRGRLQPADPLARGGPAGLRRCGDATARAGRAGAVLPAARRGARLSAGR